MGHLKGKPNILLIVADDMGYSDLGCFGGEIHTPSIDAIAARGVRATNFCVAPSYSPTGSMLLSGTDSHIAGIGNMAEWIGPTQRGKPGYEGHLNSRFTSMASRLKDVGYHTYMAGKWHVGEEPDQWPFFAYLAYQAPHGPFAISEDCSDRYLGKYDRGYDVVRDERLARQKSLGIMNPGVTSFPRLPNIPAWESLTIEQRKQASRKMEIYAAMVECMDNQVGRLIDSVKKIDQYDKSLLHVMEIMPTFLELAGVSNDSSSSVEGSSLIQGKSMWPVLSACEKETRTEDDWLGWQLFNLRTDPAEMKDLSSAYPEKRMSLLKLWDEYVKKNNVVVSDAGPFARRAP